VTDTRRSANLGRMAVDLSTSVRIPMTHDPFGHLQCAERGQGKALLADSGAAVDPDLPSSPLASLC
jgi:hypothetical protein